MTELSREILENYQLRKTKRQKLAFIHLLKTHIPELQVLEGGFPKNRNLLIGDPQTAKLLLSAHYDTCARLPFPNLITPKAPLLSVIYSILIAIPYFAVILLLNLLLQLLSDDFWLRYLLSMSVCAVLIWLMLAGPANKHTANDNTSGVITLLEIYHRLNPAQRQQVCFVFFDNEEQGLLGSAQFRKQYKKAIKDKLLINFDCVSDGDHLLIGISKKANRKYHVPIAQAFSSGGGKQVMLEKLKNIYYPSDQAGFPLAVAVAALKYKKPFGYYMDRIHTKHDTVFDESNIAYLTEHTVQFVESI